MTNYNKRLDDILYDYWARHRNCDKGCQSPDSGEITKQAFLRWVADEVVGEDKIIPTVAALSPEFLDAYYKGRKHLRLEQRQVLVQHGYKGEDDE